MSWPDGGATPFKGEKATNWEGGYRVPTVIRWPGTITPGTVYNEMLSHYDLLPTFAAAGGDPDIVAKASRGSQIGAKAFKVHLDGNNLIPFFKGEAKEAPRKEYVYWNDDGELVAIRVQDWKVVFKEQTHKRMEVWSGTILQTCVFRSFSTSGPIHSSVATSRSCTTNGWWIARLSKCRCRRRLLNGSRASRNSRFVRNLPASTSTR